MPNEQELFSETLEYIKTADINKRKALGQYFTRRSIRTHLLKKLPAELFGKTGLMILDPACGTGEFLASCHELFKEPQLMGWDIDYEVIQIAKKIAPYAKLKVIDALRHKTKKRFDLIVGNPPYFEFKPPKKIQEEYWDVINGRANIYSLFIVKSIKLLKEGGFLAFVVPPAMNTGAYFSKLREFIIRNTNIEYLEILKHCLLFDGANQSVMLLILKKGKNKGDYIVKRGNITIFSQNANFLNKELKGKLTLKELGYFVRTGRIVWNQHKNSLTDNDKDILLIWAHNIGAGKLILNNHKNKKQYIKSNSYDVAPAIVVNRIIGQPGKRKIRATLIPTGKRFLAENHVNVIFPKNPAIPIEAVLEQLNSPDKLKILQEITGNTQLSKNELENLFPFNKT